MGFKGYWFNKIKQKYTTNKYPHCYVGVINKLGGLGVHWGKFDNLYNRGSAIFGKFDNLINRVSARFGTFIPVEFKDAIHFGYLDNVKNKVSASFGSLNEGGNDMVVSHTLGLNTDDFMINYIDGFTMAVEGQWHKLEPIALDNSYTLYDADLNPLNPTNYGIVIYYKLVIPASMIIDRENDWITSNGNYGFNKAGRLGTPINIQDNKNADALLFNVVPLEYFLPPLNETSIPNEDFATGASIASTHIYDSSTNKDYVQAATPYATRPEKFLFFNSVHTNNNKYDERQVRVVFNTDTDSVTYSIITDGNGLNLPVGDYKQSYANYLMPLLFKPMGLRTACPAYDNQTDQYPELNAWIYCVLGVKEMES